MRLIDVPVAFLCLTMLNACNEPPRPPPVADTSPPTVSICSSVDATFIGERVTLTVTATDNDLVSEVAIFRGDTPLATRTQMPYTLEITLLAADQPSASFSATAVDRAGNRARSSEIRVTVRDRPDTTPPSVALRASENAFFDAGTVTLSAEATDDRAVSAVEFYRGDTRFAITTTPPYTAQLPVSSADNGELVLSARALDAAGNTARSAPLTVNASIFTWWKRITTTTAADTELRQIAIDQSGNVFIAGAAATGAPVGTRLGAFLLKFNAAGTLLWRAPLGDDAAALVNGLAVDAAGVAYAVGTRGGRRDASGNYVKQLQSYITKVTADGGVAWTTIFGSVASDIVVDYANTIAADGNGNSYIVGDTSAVFAGQRSLGDGDAFVVSFDPQGRQRWVRQFGTADSDAAGQIASDAAGTLYVLGVTNGTFPAQTKSGSSDLFLARFDAVGNRQWVRQTGSLEDDGARGVALAAGAVYVIGSGYGPLPGEQPLALSQGYLMKFDLSGTQLFARRMGEAVVGISPAAITVDASERVFVAGRVGWQFLGEPSLDGGNGSFIARFDAAGNRVWVRQFGPKYPPNAIGMAGDSSGNVFFSNSSRESYGGRPSTGTLEGFTVGLDASGSRR